MKLRSGRFYCTMNPNEVTISQAAAFLTELYKNADTLMTDYANVDNVKSVLSKINSTYALK